jgi:hypothetical protein
MAIEDSLPVELPTGDTNLTTVFYLFVAVPTVLGAAHHIDHIIRGNHVRWPLTPEVNPFTYSLAIYPLLAVSLYLSLTNRVDARYWAGFFAFSTGMLAYFHVSPWAVEPPQDVMVPSSHIFPSPYLNPVEPPQDVMVYYESTLLGSVAFGIVLALIASTVIGSVYGAVLWYRGELR